MAAAAAQSRPWADLPPELLSCIAGHLTVRSYAACRQLCSAWRSTLEPPSLSLFGASKTNDGEMAPCASTFSLPLRRTLHLPELPSYDRCVGSSDGWLALTGKLLRRALTTRILLVNPVSGEEITLPHLDLSLRSVSKLVFAPNPSKGNFTAVAIYGVGALAYVSARHSTAWSVIHILLSPINEVDYLTDVVFDGGGDGDGKAYCLTNRGAVHVMSIVPCDDGACHRQTAPVVETLLPGRAERSLSNYNPDEDFPPPYDNVSRFVSAKHLVLCGCHLYQVWRNSSCAVSLEWWERGQGSCRLRLPADEIIVLRYHPERRPCWGAVNDLGGHSVFVGKNNVLSVRPGGGAPWVRANCVYWISTLQTEPAMVFDMKTRRSTPACSGPSSAGLHRTICWLGAVNGSHNSYGEELFDSNKFWRIQNTGERESELNANVR